MKFLILFLAVVVAAALAEPLHSSSSGSSSSSSGRGLLRRPVLLGGKKGISYGKYTIIPGKKRLHSSSSSGRGGTYGAIHKYQYGYKLPNGAQKTEIRTAKGTVKGSYKTPLQDKKRRHSSSSSGWGK